MGPRTATASRREGGFKPEIERLRALFWSEDAGDLAPGVAGNEILTSATAVLLTALLIAEGVTVIHMNGLGTVHMFIGMVLIPPTSRVPCARWAPTGSAHDARPCGVPACARCSWWPRSAVASRWLSHFCRA